MSQELIVIEEAKALTAFNAGSIEQLVSEVEEIARSIVLDASTASGRKEIASVAYKVAQSKTLIDNVGKKIVEGWKAQSKVIDGARAIARDRLDALKEEIRRPVTEFEQREKDRIAGHELIISSMATIATAPYETAGQAEQAFELLDGIDTAQLEEFKERGVQAKMNAMESLGGRIASMRQAEAEKAELERLRKEAEERALEDRIRQAAEEATRRAQEEAERKAADEIAKVEAERQSAIREREAAEARAKKAEEDAKASAMKAEEDAKRAVAAAEEQARRAIEAAAEEARAVKAAEEKRAANVEHRRSINRDILADLVAAGLTEDDAKLVVIAINKGVLRHVSVRF